MKLPLPVFVILLALVAPVRAESPASPPGPHHDLGRGLVFHRVHTLPADLPAAEYARNQSCVLDLRFVTSDADTAAPLIAWIRFHAAPRTPVLILANAATSRALLAPLTGRESAGSVVVLGAAAPGFEPDISLSVPPGADRRAYDALESGAELDSLLVENVDKPRNDEARLAHDHLPDSTVADGAAAHLPFGSAIDSIAANGTPATATGAKNDKPPAPVPPVDAVLQRAVQLHRTLLALHKI